MHSLGLGQEKGEGSCPDIWVEAGFVSYLSFKFLGRRSDGGPLGNVWARSTPLTQRPSRTACPVD